MAEYQPRINTSSRKVAIFSKYFMARALKHPFDLAVSTKNYIMLDFDGDDLQLALLEARTIGEALVDMYGGECYIYRSPHGYHLLFKKWMSWKEVRRFIAGLLQEVRKGTFKSLDEAHLDASLRRGYLTLRLNQRLKVLTLRKVGERVEAYGAIRG